MKKTYLYYRLLTPNRKVPNLEEMNQMISLANADSKIAGEYIEKYNDPQEFKVLQKLLDIVGKTPSIIRVPHYSHLGVGNLEQVLWNMSIFIERGHSIVAGGKIISPENWEEASYFMRLSIDINARLRQNNIRTGLEKKKKESPDGSIHKKGKKGNYRKTDKDEIVSELRNKGMTLQQIADHESISVGRVRSIIKASQDGGMMA